MKRISILVISVLLLTGSIFLIVGGNKAQAYGIVCSQSGTAGVTPVNSATTTPGGGGVGFGPWESIPNGAGPFWTDNLTGNCTNLPPGTTCNVSGDVGFNYDEPGIAAASLSTSPTTPLGTYSNINVNIEQPYNDTSGTYNTYTCPVSLQVLPPPITATCTVKPSSVASGGTATFTVTASGGNADMYSLSINNPGSQIKRQINILACPTVDGQEPVGPSNIKDYNIIDEQNPMGYPPPLDPPCDAGYYFTGTGSDEVPDCVMHAGGVYVFKGICAASAPSYFYSPWTYPAGDATASTCPNGGSTCGTSPITANISSGAFQVTVSDSAGDPSVTASCPGVTVTPAPSFTLSANPNSLSIPQGSQGTSTITITPLNGFSGNVNLSASGLPSGVTAAFSPDPATSNSILTLTASASAAIGTNTVTITGTSGGLTATTTISLTVISSVTSGTISVASVNSQNGSPVTASWDFTGPSDPCSSGPCKNETSETYKDVPFGFYVLDPQAVQSGYVLSSYSISPSDGGELSGSSPTFDFSIQWNPEATMFVSPATTTITTTSTGSVSFTVKNTGPAGSVLNWKASSNAGWAIPTTAGTVSGGGSGSAGVAVDASKLAAGSYIATITYSGTSALTGDDLGSQAVYVKLTVPAPAGGPPTVNLGSAYSEINYGATDILNWTTSNASSCTASNGIKEGDWLNNKPTANSAPQTQDITPTATGTIIYGLTCSEPGEPSAHDSVSLQVDDIVCGLQANPTRVVIPGTTVLSYNCSPVSSAYSCSLTGTDGTSYSVNPPDKTQTVKGSDTAAPLANTIYTIACVGPGGSTASANTTVSVTNPGLGECNPQVNPQGCPPQ